MSALTDLITDAGWRDVLGPVCIEAQVENMLLREDAEGETVYPPRPQIFSAFNLTPFNKVRVVILGQDPYHGEGQAMGLAFSVPAATKLPPSLRNIFKEIQSDLGGPLRASGDLTDWAAQGVLLMNTVLTVRKGAAASHAGKGWEAVTKAAVAALSDTRSGIVYLLWGSHAQEFAKIIDPHKNTILTAPHPSPLSAYRGFFGCKHFSKANTALKNQGLTEVNWSK